MTSRWYKDGIWEIDFLNFTVWGVALYLFSSPILRGPRLSVGIFKKKHPNLRRIPFSAFCHFVEVEHKKKDPKESREGIARVDAFEYQK